MKRSIAVAPRMLTMMLTVLSACSAQPAANRPGQVKVNSHTPGLRFVQWTDPKENAFSTAVPVGWQANGGLFRFSPIDTRSAIEAMSPDGIRISMGDPYSSTFMGPNGILDRTGYREGSRYPNGYGGTIPVMRYIPGTQFAEEYVRNRAAAQCSGITVVDRRDRPELSESLNRILALMPGVIMEMTTGEVIFTCTINGRSMRGYYFAGTILSQGSNGLTMWFLQHLYGYLAPAEKAGVAQAALQQLIGSHRVNPGWASAQSSATMRASQIMVQSNAQISKIISDSYWSRARSLDTAFRNGANARRGTTDVADPNTGETWNVYGGYRWYWRIPGSDVVIGTNSTDPPAGNAVPLAEY